MTVFEPLQKYFLLILIFKIFNTLLADVANKSAPHSLSWANVTVFHGATLDLAHYKLVNTSPFVFIDLR